MLKIILSYDISKSYWLQDVSEINGNNTYAAHRMMLLYIAITKRWPAALYYEQQGTDDFWLQYQPPPRPGTAQGKCVGCSSDALASAVNSMHRLL